MTVTIVRVALKRLLILLCSIALGACASYALPPFPSANVNQQQVLLSPQLSEQAMEAVRILKLRAEAMFSANNPVGATAVLVQREHYLLNDPQALRRNHNEIWNGLTGRRLASADLSGLQQASPVTRGWVELAVLAQQGASLKQYEAWQQIYPNHPGADHLPALMMPGAGPSPLSNVGPYAGIANPAAPFTLPALGQGHAALLLPLSGPLQAAANKVRQGYLAAQNRFNDGELPAQIYDASGDNADNIGNIYQQALNGGAGIIVGPLQKQAVTALAQQGAPAVPVLALNYLNSGSRAPAGLLQFGLAPEDEARQAADNAFARGLRRAVVLVPDDPRGSRILTAFTQRLQQLGGNVAARTQFPPGTTDFSPLVRSLLDIDQSMARDKAVANALGRRSEFEPRRRGDVDFIFISGAKTKDRLMASMFRYWRADTLPVYATAEVNHGPGDSDLAGIRFCDDPWLLEPGPQWDAVRAQIGQAAAQGHGYARLYALGMDAARLVHRLRQGAMLAGEEVMGYSGDLSIGSDGVVHRHLACAQIVNGAAPQPLDNPVLPVPGQTALGMPTSGYPVPDHAETAPPGAAQP